MPIARWVAMLEAAPTTIAAALVLGAAGSLHCFVMCGPLACAIRPRADETLHQIEGRRRRRREAVTAAVAYHLARIAAYAAVGAVAGLLGARVRLPLQGALPWLLAAVLLLAAIDPRAHWTRRLRPLPLFAKILRSAARLRATLSVPAQGALLGALTPLLPCGLLYGIVAAALAAASPGGGALLMGGFALGAVPALLAAQLSVGWSERLGRLPAALLQRLLPLAAAACLIYRATLPLVGHACH
jgi:sulfite exporter TauE/SafE